MDRASSKFKIGVRELVAICSLKPSVAVTKKTLLSQLRYNRQSPCLVDQPRR